MTCSDIPVHEYDVNKVAKYVKFMAQSFYVTSAALQYFNVDVDFPARISSDPFLCPTISSFTGDAFDIYKIFSNECDNWIDGDSYNNYWKGPSSGPAYVEIDLGVLITINKITVKNGKNGDDNDG